MSTLVFAPLTSTTGNANGMLPALRGFAFEVTPAGAGHGQLPALRSRAVASDIGYASAALPAMRGLALDAAGSFVTAALPRLLGFASGGTSTPAVGLGYAALPAFSASSTGFTTAYGNGNAALPAMRSLALQADGYVHAALQRIIGSAYQVTPPASFLTLLQSAGFAAITSTSSMVNLLADRMQLAGVTEADFIQALLDLIQYSDSYTRAAQVLQALVDGLSLADVAAMILQADLLDSFIASAVQVGTAQLTVMLADGLVLGDASSALSEILAALRDGFYASLTLVTGDDVYTAWVMTPETKAMRSYSNFPFNSYAQLGDQFFGAGPNGIYRMGGTTDNGAAIASTIRTGLLNFGTQGMKGVQRAYIGATAAGELLLRVQALTRNSDMLEQTYRISPLVTDAPREYGVDVGRGFRSVYWTFELANDLDGAAFEVNDWHVLPVFFSGKLNS